MRVTFIKKKCEKLIKYSTLIQLISTLPLHNYITKLLVQFLGLNETCRMIGYSLLSNDVNIVQIEFEWL